MYFATSFDAKWAGFFCLLLLLLLLFIYLFIYLFIFYKICLLISDMRVLNSADLFVSIFTRVPPCNIKKKKKKKNILETLYYVAIKNFRNTSSFSAFRGS